MSEFKSYGWGILRAGSPVFDECCEVVESKSAVGLAVEELQHRQVVDPAPAPAQRWRCDGCGVSYPDDQTAVGKDGTRRHWTNTFFCGPCGPCAPVTDVEPAGAADGEAG